MLGKLFAPLKSALGLIVILQAITIGALAAQTFYLTDQLQPPGEYDIAEAVSRVGVDCRQPRDW